MAQVKDTNYYYVMGWMLRIGLSGYQLPVYAIIYGFSQDGESEFSGSLNYLAEFANCTQRNIQKVLKQLEEKKLITKRSYMDDNIKKVFYKAVVPRELSSMVENMVLGGRELSSLANDVESRELSSMGYGTEFLEGRELSSTNNKHIYNNNNNNTMCAGKPKKKIVRKKYGTHQNLFLSDHEIEQLKNLYPDDWERYLQEASEHLGPDESKTKAYSFVKNWGARDYQRINRGNNTKPKVDKPKTVEDALAKLVI